MWRSSECLLGSGVLRAIQYSALWEECVMWNLNLLFPVNKRMLSSFQNKYHKYPRAASSRNLPICRYGTSALSKGEVVRLEPQLFARAIPK